MDKLVPFLNSLAIVVLLVIYRLFVITKVWTLVVVPLGAPAIGLKVAYGIALLVSAVSGVPETKSVNAWATAGSLTITWIFAHLFFG